MEHSNDLLARYLYAIRAHLPVHRQDDILNELSANLNAQAEDKAAELGRPLTAEEHAELLERHGHPILVAARYHPRRSLIGPEIFPFYWFTLERVLPLVLGVYLLVQAAVLLFGNQGAPIGQKINVGALITGLLGALFQSLAWITACFAVVEYCMNTGKGNIRRHLEMRHWDPHKLPSVSPAANLPGPRHPYADVIAGAAFLAWLLVFPRFPVLMFGPTVSWHLLNMDLPAIWHQFYWVIVGFQSIQLALRIALLNPPIRRYYHFVEAAIHLLSIGILVFLLRTHDYVSQGTFGGAPLAPETVLTLNRNIHAGLWLVLIIAIGKFFWDTAQWLRLHASNPKPLSTQS